MEKVFIIKKHVRQRPSSVEGTNQHLAPLVLIIEKMVLITN